MALTDAAEVAEVAAEPGPSAAPHAGWGEGEHMERWLFDLNGYLAVRGVVDAAWLTELHAAIDAGRQDPSLQVGAGLGRAVASQHRSPTSYQNRAEIQWRRRRTLGRSAGIGARFERLGVAVRHLGAAPRRE